MPPTLLCVCLFLLATCSARPNWHKGVVVEKKIDLPPPHPFALPEYSDAQVAAAQAIRDAGEDVQLHMAMLKKQYMDVVRQHFYNAFAPRPFVKERLGNFEPSQHSEDVLPVKKIPPQPLYIHHTAANNPCSGNILNCLHVNSPSRLGKIVPPPSAGIQPCFGPNCNHVFFSPQFKPIVIPKPSHSSHITNQNPSKRPHKHHRICDRKRPDHTCHHRGTFWPTYATVKLNTKFVPSAVFSPEEIKHKISLSTTSTPSEDHVTTTLQQNVILPSKDSTSPTNSTTVQSNPDKKFGIETLQSNTSILENEMLGILEDVVSNSGVQSIVTPASNNQSPSEAKDEYHTESLLSSLSVNVISSTSETADELSPEYKEDTTLKANMNVKHTTPKFSFHTNDVIELLTDEMIEPTPTSDNSFVEEKKITTSSILSHTSTELNNEEIFKLEGEIDPSVQDEILTKYTTVPTKNAMLESITSSSLKELDGLVAMTTIANEEEFDRTTGINLDNRMGEGVTEGSTLFPGDKKLDFKPTTVSQNPKWKSEIEFITTKESLPGASSPGTHLGTNVHDNQQTAETPNYFSEVGTSSIPSLKTLQEENGQFLYTTTNVDNDYITRILKNDLAETNATEDFLQPSSELVFGNPDVQRESTIQTTLRADQNVTQSPLEYFTDQGREDTTVHTDNSDTTENNGIDSRNIAEENTTPVILFSGSDSYKVFEETTLEPDFSVGTRENIFSETEASNTLNLDSDFDTEDNLEAREEAFTNSHQTDSHFPVKLDNFQPTQSDVEEIKALSMQLPDTHLNEIILITTEESMRPVSDSSLGLKDNQFSTIINTFTLNMNNNIGTEDSQKSRENPFTESFLTDPYSNLGVTDFQSTHDGLEDIKAQSTEQPNSDKKGVVLITTEDSSGNTEPHLGEELINNEISTQTNDFDGPSYLATENSQETVKNQESFNDSKAELLDFAAREEDYILNYDRTRAQTESSFFQETTYETKINWEDENSIIKSTIKPIKEWTSEKSDTTEYFPVSREDLSQDYDHHLNHFEEAKIDQALEAVDVPTFTMSPTELYDGIVPGETTTEAKSIDVTTNTPTSLNGIEYGLNKLSSSTENNVILFSTISSSSNRPTFKLSDDNENSDTSTSHTYLDNDEYITSENRLSELPPQSREGDEEETPLLPDITSETSTNRKSTDNQVEKTTLLTITENNQDEITQDIALSEVTEVPELRVNIDESSPIPTTSIAEYTETGPTESGPNNEFVWGTKIDTKENSFESNPIISQELFGKTDSPGLQISEDWTEERAEDTSINILTELSLLGKGVITEYLQPKAEEDDVSEVFPNSSATDPTDADATARTEPITTNHDHSSHALEGATVSNFQTSPSEVYVTTPSVSIEGTMSEIPFNENPSPQSYQSGVLKFTTEIEFTTEDDQLTDVPEGSTNSELTLELNESLNRKVRSVQHREDEVKSYPTTECILCLLGLPHGHRMRRSSENTSHDIVKDNNQTNSRTKVLHSEKSNCSFVTDSYLEDPENPSLYASTILELLPVIREGYRNNAFSEEDKKVIRSIFCDMKTLIDEDMFEAITESSADLLMGDGASSLDELIEDIDYDSSEDDMSESEIRLKRSKKNLHIMNDLLKKIPNDSKTHFNIPSELRNSRVVRSTHVSQAEASAILALLAEKGEAVQLDNPDDEDDDEYEYYEEEGADYEDDDSYIEDYEDDYHEPSFGELIKLARKHRERKSRAEQS